LSSVVCLKKFAINWLETRPRVIIVIMTSCFPALDGAYGNSGAAIYWRYFVRSLAYKWYRAITSDVHTVLKPDVKLGYSCHWVSLSFMTAL